MNRCGAVQVAFAAMLLAASGLSACGTTNPLERPAATTQELEGTIVVLAAASLTKPLADIEKDFEADNPGVDVQVTAASSATVVQQVNAGAPADILITAGQEPLNDLHGNWHEADAPSIASNQLAIATPPKNPAGVKSVKDLGKSGTSVVLCVATAPCGKAADGMLAAAGVKAHVVSRESDARATLAKVKLGEVDAAVVYASDVATAYDTVHGVEIPGQLNVSVDYPALNLSGSQLADAFEDYLRGTAAGWTLAADGFGRPGAGAS